MTHERILNDILHDTLRYDEPMSRHTTLKVGGAAQWFWPATDLDSLSALLTACTEYEIPYLFLGHGSNILMSDSGYAGLVIQNRCKKVTVEEETIAESGVSFGSLFLQTAKAGFKGLEWAIGIPGTVGGALVSNAGAYRGNIGPMVQSLRVFTEGKDQIVDSEWMGFSYRDSRLRRSGVGKDVILSCNLKLQGQDEPEIILKRAKEYQLQRRNKQPYAPSAGSFFKNVINKSLAETLPGLTSGMREAGVIPAGFLIEASGLKGLQYGGSQSSLKHANFLINLGNATAMDFRTLANLIKTRVWECFGVLLEEEVLYLGKWPEHVEEESG